MYMKKSVLIDKNSLVMYTTHDIQSIINQIQPTFVFFCAKKQLMLAAKKGNGNFLMHLYLQRSQIKNLCEESTLTLQSYDVCVDTKNEIQQLCERTSQNLVSL